MNGMDIAVLSVSIAVGVFALAVYFYAKKHPKN